MGSTTRYANVEMEYPCLIFSGNVEKFKVQILKNMVNVKDVTDDDMIVHIYLNVGDQTIGIGLVKSTQVTALMGLLSNMSVEAWLDKSRRLEGDMVYVLAE